MRGSINVLYNPYRFIQIGENFVTKTEYEKLFDQLIHRGNSTMLNLIYVSLISSDTVTDLEKCNKSKEELQKMLEAVISCDIDHNIKDEWKRRIETGLEICEREKHNFISEISNEIH